MSDKTAEQTLLSQQIQGLSILSREKVASFLTGSRRSLFRGEGTEFADMREYLPGDDTRHIDWNATAKRFETLIIREYEVERNTNVVLLLDASASLLIGKSKPRIVMATEAIAALAEATIQNKDLIGFAAFSNEINLFIPPKGGKLHQYYIYKQLLNLIPKGKTNLGEALKSVATNLNQRSLIIIITDLHDDYTSTLNGFRIAKALNHEVLLLQISDYGEYYLPENTGKIKFKHPKTGKPETIDFSDPVAKGLYHFHIQKELDELNTFKRNLRGLRVKVVESKTEDLIEQILLAYFSAKSRGYTL